MSDVCELCLGTLPRVKICVSETCSHPVCLKCVDNMYEFTRTTKNMDLNSLLVDQKSALKMQCPFCRNDLFSSIPPVEGKCGCGKDEKDLIDHCFGEDFKCPMFPKQFRCGNCSECFPKEHDLELHLRYQCEAFGCGKCVGSVSLDELRMKFSGMRFVDFVMHFQKDHRTIHELSQATRLMSRIPDPKELENAVLGILERKSLDVTHLLNIRQIQTDCSSIISHVEHIHGVPNLLMNDIMLSILRGDI